MQEAHSKERRDASPGEAIEIVSRHVQDLAGGDLGYFQGQRQRYETTVRRIGQLLPPAARILDVGSHYLHQSALLSAMGYQVTGIDLPLFAEASFVQRRARDFNIENTAVASLEKGEFLLERHGYFDAVVFTETLEHITFNPVAYWKRIYELLSERGFVYLTTPNSYRPGALARSLGRLLTLRGLGVSVADILDTVTYGHHWKEYAPAELKEYFFALSHDFRVEISMHNNLPARRVPRVALQILGLFPLLRSDIEAVVRLQGKTSFIGRPPNLPMHAE